MELVPRDADEGPERTIVFNFGDEDDGDGGDSGFGNSDMRRRNASAAAAATTDLFQHERNTAAIDTVDDERRRELAFQREYLSRRMEDFDRMKRETDAAETAAASLAREKFRHFYHVKQIAWLFRFHLGLVAAMWAASALLYDASALVYMCAYAPILAVSALALWLLGFRTWMIRALRVLAGINLVIALFLLIFRVFVAVFDVSLQSSLRFSTSIRFPYQPPPTRMARYLDIVLVVLQFVDMLVSVLYFQAADQTAIARGRMSCTIAKMYRCGLATEPAPPRRRNWRWRWWSPLTWCRRRTERAVIMSTAHSARSSQRTSSAHAAAKEHIR